MKVVIAAWHLKNVNVGLGRYANGLIEAIGRVDRDNQYEILIPNDSHPFSPRPNMRYRLIRFPLFKRRFWEQLAPLLAGRHDVLHFPYDSRVAWKRAKFVTTIHDVKPLLFETGRRRRNLNHVIERTLVGSRWGQIDHVVTVSECSRCDIMAHLGLPKDRLTVVYPGIDLERFRPALAGSPKTSAARPYVLCVAGADPTKNLEVLIDAFARLPSAVRAAHDLVLTGDFRRRADLRARVAQSGIQAQSIFTGVVSDERLIELYRAAAVFVFPSLYEGFGLPVLEAMACGCPVISSDASSLPEVAGEAAVLVDPRDVGGLASAMERVLGGADVRLALRERGLEQAARFPWERTARETIAVYRNVVGE
ncbi:MAG: glycosyltransferase family 4 protein [Nitrospiraceae bacterium]